MFQVLQETNTWNLLKTAWHRIWFFKTFLEHALHKTYWEILTQNEVYRPIMLILAEHSNGLSIQAKMPNNVNKIQHRYKNFLKQSNNWLPFCISRKYSLFCPFEILSGSRRTKGAKRPRPQATHFWLPLQKESHSKEKI